ncbi:alpha/beta hydrolase [Humibacter antri]
MLLVHGFASDGRADWEDAGFVDELAARGRGAIVIDLPGHGEGPALSRGEATTGTVADALADVVDASGHDVLDVVGYSLGARLAWALAATGRVRRLVLGGLSPMDPFAALDADALTAVVAGEREPADPLQAMFAQMLTIPGLEARSVIALMEALSAEPFDPAVDVPAVPTLFLSGTDDPMAQGVETLAAGVPGATLVRVPGDHHGTLRSPEFRDAALGFLAE